MFVLPSADETEAVTDLALAAKVGAVLAAQGERVHVVEHVPAAASTVHPSELAAQERAPPQRMDGIRSQAVRRPLDEGMQIESTGIRWSEFGQARKPWSES